MAEPQHPGITAQAQILADADLVLAKLGQGPATAAELTSVVGDDDVRLGYAIADLHDRGKIEADPPLTSWHRGSKGARVYRLIDLVVHVRRG